MFVDARQQHQSGNRPTSLAKLATDDVMRSSAKVTAGELSNVIRFAKLCAARQITWLPVSRSMAPTQSRRLLSIPSNVADCAAISPPYLLCMAVSTACNGSAATATAVHPIY